MDSSHKSLLNKARFHWQLQYSSVNFLSKCWPLVVALIVIAWASNDNIGYQSRDENLSRAFSAAASSRYDSLMRDLPEYAKIPNTVPREILRLADLNQTSEGTIRPQNPSDIVYPVKPIIKNVSERDWVSRNLTKLSEQLLNWVKEHPTEFTPAMKKFLGYKSGALTSRISLIVGDQEQEYELYLLCFDIPGEVGIALIRDDRVIMLRGGIGFGNFWFWAGKVARMGGEISEVIPVRAPIQQEDKTRFNNIFLSWWDKTRNKNISPSN